MSASVAVIVQSQAIADVDEIAGRIAADDLDAALRFYDAVATTYAFLGQHPLVGSRRTAIDPRLRGLRSYGVIGFRGYLIFFLSDPSSVRVVRVLHGARDTDQIMGPVG